MTIIVTMTMTMTMAVIIMAYGSMPYVGIAPKKMVATLKVRK